MRSKTKDELLFNKQAKKYGIHAFTATQFDKDDAIQKALISFVKYKDFKLNDDFSNLEDYDSSYFDYFLENAEGTNEFNLDIHKNAEEVESAQKLFELISPVKKIACIEYYETETQGFVEVQTENGSRNDSTIYDLVVRWHRFRREVDKIKPFIRERFPRWDNAGVKEKKQYKEDIKKLIKNLEILGNDTKQLKRVDYFLSNYSGLNQITKFKMELLLALKLPQINSKEIAKIIIDFSEY